MTRTTPALSLAASLLLAACASTDAGVDGAAPADAADVQAPDADAVTSPDAAPDAALPDAMLPDAALPDAMLPDAAAPDAAAAPEVGVDASDDAQTPAWLAGSVACGSATCAAGQVCLYFVNVDPSRGPECSRTLSPAGASDCPAGAACRDLLARECGTMSLNVDVRTRHVTCCYGAPTACPTL